MVAGTKAALENGVKVGLGTDTGCPYTTHSNAAFVPATILLNTTFELY